MSGCIINAIKVIQPKLASGNLGDGFKVPGLEPFIIKYLEVNYLKFNFKFQGADNLL